MPYTPEDNNLLRVIGQNLKKARLAKGWSQEQLSFESGLHRTYVGAVERGERNITVINLRKLANVLDVKLSALVKGT
ncbi:MAG: helix-turn-helix transcriptional regulator [candidate division WOR-3 bacterium]|nr:helix-turn-helix transcriptional regulator [candidate division WOR-3 bacterium]